MTDEHYPTFFVADLDWDDHRWSSRAWTLQEQAVSRRLLGFGSSRIYFECATRLVIESSIGPWQEWKSNNVEAEIKRRYKVGSAKMKERLYSEWASDIGGYSDRKLTDPRDKLPAISAMAKRVQKLAGGEEKYLAGLWEGDLPLGLLWVVDEPEVEGLVKLLARSSLRPYISPTWSWASQETAVTFLYDPVEGLKRHDIRPECEIASAWTKLEDSSNVYGRIQDAGLIVNAKLVSFKSVLPESWCTDLEGWWFFHFNERGTVDLDLDWISNEEELHQQDVFMLLLASTYHSTGSKQRDSSKDNDTSLHEIDDTSSDNDNHDASVKNNHADLGNIDCHAAARNDHTGPERRTHISSNDDDVFGLGKAEDNLLGSSQCSIGTTDSVVQDKTHRNERTAWGIVLHPADEDGKYVRIGQFSCEPADDGSLSGFWMFDS